MKTHYSTSEVAALTGLSVRQLHWYARKNILAAPKSGHNRIFDEDHLYSAKKISQLRKAGVPLQKCRRVIRARTKFDSVVYLKAPMLINGVLIVPAIRLDQVR